MNVNTYSGISARQAAYTKTRLLKRAQPYMFIERFGQKDVLPSRQTNVVMWRRYEALAAQDSPVAEVGTIPGETLTSTDVTAVMEMYSILVWITRKISDFHEDPVLMDAGDNAGEAMAMTVEKVRFATAKAGTNVIFANGATTRATVNSPLTINDLHKAERALRRARARTIGEIIAPTPNVSTQAVAPAYFALCHVDCIADLKKLENFTRAENYPSVKALPGEVGSWGPFRFLASDLYSPWLAAGTAGTTYLSGGDKPGSSLAADVYPILVFSKDAFGIVPFQGMESNEVHVKKPGQADTADPTAKLGFVCVNRYDASAILQELHLLRFEVAATAL